MREVKKNALLLAMGVCGLAAGLLAFAPRAQAASQSRTVLAPYTQKGEQAFPEYSGCDYVHTAGTTEVLLSSGPLVLYGVYMSTGAVTSFVTIRDSNTLTGNGTAVLDRIPYATTLQLQREILPFPIRFYTGATMIIGGTAAIGETATACYRKQQ